MIQSYRDRKTAGFADGKSVAKWRSFAKVALRKLDMLGAADDLRDLKVPPSNKLEKLKGDRKGQYSIRINDQWRICFDWDGKDAFNVEIVDYH